MPYKTLEINDSNNIYVGEDGKTYAVRLNVAKDENGEDVEYYSKHLYDPKTDVMDSSELPFDKEEWFDGRDQIDDMTQIKSPQLRENDGSEERVEEFSKRRDVNEQKQKYTRDRQTIRVEMVIQAERIVQNLLQMKIILRTKEENGIS